MSNTEETDASVETKPSNDGGEDNACRSIEEKTKKKKETSVPIIQKSRRQQKQDAECTETKLKDLAELSIRRKMNRDYELSSGEMGKRC
eukprot:10788262-Ditylum_brightwellii.AAC.1